MKSSALLLLSWCGVCAAAQPASAGSDDAAWLRDPVAAVLASAAPAAAPTPAEPTVGAGAGRATREPESPLSLDYLKVIALDAKETAIGPFHWDRDDWVHAAEIGGGLAITIAFLDKPIHDLAQRNRSASTDRFFGDIQKFGTKQYGLPVLAGFYVYGLARDDYAAKTTALDGFSASFISSIATSILKGAFGRARPNTGLSPHHWRPFGGDQSFPSGHTTGAFAFASVIAAHYDNVWIDTTAYTIASLVGVARIERNAHWASDVVGGALVGGLIGHHLVNFNERLRERGGSWAPTLGTDGSELTVSWTF